MLVDAKRSKALKLAGVLLGLIVVYQLAVKPALRGVDALERKVAAQERDREATLRLASELERIRQSSRGPSREPSAATISSLPAWLERHARRLELADNLRQISPLGIGIDNRFRERATVRIEDVSMAGALRFLDLVESTPGLRIVTAELKRQAGDRAGLSLALEVGLN